MRSFAEVVAFMDSQVGRIPYHPKPREDLSGQCVTGVKVLLDFLGVPNPYAARGDAKDVGDALIRQGIGTAGRGRITIVVNRDMGYIGGVRYGHIWTDLMNVANYESNGNRALYMTKNTRPLSQGQQFINLDQWITGDNNTMNDDDAKEVYRGFLHREPENDQVWRGFVGKRLSQVSGGVRNSPEWLTQNHMIAFFGQREQQLNEARGQLAQANEALKVALSNDEADKAAVLAAQKQTQDALDNLNIVTNKFNEVSANYEAAKAENAKADETGNAFLRWLGKLLNGGK